MNRLYILEPLNDGTNKRRSSRACIENPDWPLSNSLHVLTIISESMSKDFDYAKAPHRLIEVCIEYTRHFVHFASEGFIINRRQFWLDKLFSNCQHNTSLEITASDIFMNLCSEPTSDLYIFYNVPYFCVFCGLTSASLGRSHHVLGINQYCGGSKIDSSRTQPGGSEALVPESNVFSTVGNRTLLCSYDCLYQSTEKCHIQTLPTCLWDFSPSLRRHAIAMCFNTVVPMKATAAYMHGRFTYLFS